MAYVQYGCGFSAPLEWNNFDVSPTLRIQNAPVLGRLIKKKLNTIFPDNVRYGCIIKGLPFSPDSADGLYCSHTLEHLSLEDFRKAISNSYKILKPGKFFRLIVPDIEFMTRNYIKSLDNRNNEACIEFIENTLMGVKRKPRGLKNFVTSFMGNSHHLWMWDYSSMKSELKKAGFTDIRKAYFNDSADKMFSLVENKERFTNAVAIECKK